MEEENRELCQLIDEISFANSDYVTITISGLPYKLKASPLKLAGQMAGFIQFLENYQPNLSKAREFDLRYGNMIIEVAQRE